MIIIRKGNTIWFIHENWLVPLSFIIIQLIVFIIPKTLKKYLTKRKINKKKHLKGSDVEKTNSATQIRGGDIDDCVEIEGVYEIQDPSLKLTIRKVLQVGIENLPLFVETPVVILSHLINKRIKTIIFHHGMEIIIENNVKAAAKIFLGTVLSLAAGFIYSIPILPVFVLSSILAVVLRTSDINCNDLFYRLPQFKDTPGAYIDLPEISNQKIYMKGNKDLKIYRLQKIESEVCVEVEEQHDINPLPDLFSLFKPEKDQDTRPIIRNCHQKNKYVPLKHRTRTLKDLRRGDDSESREKAELIIQRYQKQGEKIKAEKE